MIEDYFQTILDLISASPLVRHHEVAFEKRSPYIGFIRGNLHFRDNSVLHFRELVNLRLSRLPAMYVYHYQNANQLLIFRYDNSEHFPALPNFPHHKHVNAESTVVPATPPELATVLKEIESLIAL